MDILSLFEGTSVSATLLNLSLVGIVGILIGKLSLGKLKLGIAGVLFAGLYAGHLGVQFDYNVLSFIKEFGLILFVYSIGIEIGPRFISSFRSNGLKLNLLAASIIILGFLIAVGITIGFGVPMPTSAGMLCGAVTNTPSLGAAQSLIVEQMADGASLALNTGMAYAIAYPFGIIGIILVMYIVRYLFRINIDTEIERHKNEADAKNQKAKTVNITVSNPNVRGKDIAFIKKTLATKFVFSRISRNDIFLIPDANVILKEGDVLYGLAYEDHFDELELTIGSLAHTQKYEHAKHLAMRHIIITNRAIAGKRIEDINFSELFPASITRIFRSDTEIIASNSTTLEFGDTIRVIGARDRMDEIAKFLGNSIHDLSHPNIIPLFVGILLGIILGSIPVFIPGLPAPAKLGLAGGPLIIALILGHMGRIGKHDFYMTPGANRYIRELGIILFLTCVGIGSGGQFWETITDGGLRLVGLSALITFVPLLIVGIVARFMKINFLTICGLLSGAMTDPPALEFANSMAPGQIQSSAYAMVYPFTMFLRILFAQIFVLMFL